MDTDFLMASFAEGRDEMDDLNELLRQRKELDRRIKELREQDTTYEDAKYFVQHYVPGRPDEFCFAIKCRKGNGLTTWKTVTAEADKEHAIGRFRKQIQDAQQLLKKMEAV